MRIVLVTGMSGSGKSVAIRLLEDAGYYCIDNLPSRFLGEVCAFLEGVGYTDVTLSVDSRSEASLADVPAIIATLRAADRDVRVLFLTASDSALVQRFSETRRRHPMSLRSHGQCAETTLLEAIALEREPLAPLVNISHVIDTSELHPNTLRQWVRQFTDVPPADLVLAFESFAFKQGVPVAADFVFDVRNLPSAQLTLEDFLADPNFAEGAPLGLADQVDQFWKQALPNLDVNRNLMRDELKDPHSGWELRQQNFAEVMPLEHAAMVVGLPQEAHPAFAKSAGQAGATLLASLDPFALTVVRTLHGLTLSTESFPRVRYLTQAWARLNPADRARLALPLPGAYGGEA